MCTPKKFLCFISLKIGALIAGLIMCVIVISTLFVAAMKLGYLSGEMSRSTTLQQFVFAYNVIAVIYAIALLILCLWFLVAVFLRQKSVILAWLVTSSIWIVLLFCVWVHVSLDLYFLIESETLTWLIVRLIVGIILLLIMAYLQMVVLGYWFELKEECPDQSSEAQP